MFNNDGFHFAFHQILENTFVLFGSNCKKRNSTVTGKILCKYELLLLFATVECTVYDIQIHTHLHLVAHMKHESHVVCVCRLCIFHSSVLLCVHQTLFHFHMFATHSTKENRISKRRERGERKKGKKTTQKMVFAEIITFTVWMGALGLDIVFWVEQKMCTWPLLITSKIFQTLKCIVIISACTMCDNRIGYGYAGRLNEDDCEWCKIKTKYLETHWHCRKKGICLKAADSAQTSMPTQMMAFHSEFSAMSRLKGHSNAGNGVVNKQIDASKHSHREKKNVIRNRVVAGGSCIFAHKKLIWKRFRRVSCVPT